MSLFKKDINEHDEFFDMVRDYIIAKATLGRVRLASASDIYTLETIGKIILAAIEDGSYERRERLRSKPVATADDFEKLRNNFRKIYLRVQQPRSRKACLAQKLDNKH